MNNSYCIIQVYKRLSDRPGNYNYCIIKGTNANISTNLAKMQQRYPESQLIINVVDRVNANALWSHMRKHCKDIISSHNCLFNVHVDFDDFERELAKCNSQFSIL